MDHLISYGLLIVGVIYMCSKSFKFEKITRFSWVVIPAYCVIMFAVNMSWNKYNLIEAGLIIVIGWLIAYFQQLQTELQVTDDVDKHDRPIIKIKRNWSYVIGWFLVFAFGIIIQILGSHELSIQEIVAELGEEIQKDLFAWKFFSNQNAWYIWLLSGANVISYTTLIIKRETGAPSDSPSMISSVNS